MKQLAQFCVFVHCQICDKLQRSSVHVTVITVTNKIRHPGGTPIPPYLEWAGRLLGLIYFFDLFLSICPMTRSPCPSSHHFSKCTLQIEGRPDKVTWKCDHCGEHVIKGVQFKSTQARIHLAADHTNGICADLCSATDEDAAFRHATFRELIKKLKEQKK